MAHTFQALLTGDQLKWKPSRPAGLPEDKPILVDVTVFDAAVLDDPILDDSASESSSGAAMSAALEQLARLALFADIDSPVEWQRDQRSDRPLPVRHSPTG
jgi:hypothetical protein